MKSNELFRASGVMALGTIISRITGFIRGILIVAVLVLHYLQIRTT